MAQLFEYIKMALMNIRSNKGRSILTMLGIIIGISSVIMVISIGNGLSSQVSDELNNLAGGQLYFYSGGSMGDTQASNEEAVEFTTEDFDLIEEKIDHVKGVSPNYQTYGTAQGPKGAFDAYLYGGTVAQQYLYNDPIVKGRYFTKADYESANKVCVIRENSAVAMFGTTDVLGRTFEVTIDGITMESTIVGIRQDSASSAISSMLMSFDQVEMEVPLTTMGAAFGYYVDTFQGFYVFTDGPEYAAEAAGAILRLLRSAHHVASDSNSIQMQNFNDSMSSITQVLSYITIFVVFVAAISLLVGGIGVMNIMLVSVTERTKEIGLKKAIGARKKTILGQFLTEASVLTSIGGIIGVVTGIGLSKVVGKVTGSPTAISVPSIVIAVLFSTVIGVVFGLLPSVKAANLNPIDALRSE